MRRSSYTNGWSFLAEVASVDTFDESSSGSTSHVFDEPAQGSDLLAAPSAVEGLGRVAVRAEALAGDAVRRGAGDRAAAAARRAADRAPAARVRRGAVVGRTSEVAKELDAEQRLAVELVAFRAEAERIANLGWEPDLDDGMVLNAAPLADLFPAWKDAADVPQGAAGRASTVGDGGPSTPISCDRAARAARRGAGGQGRAPRRRRLGRPRGGLRGGRRRGRPEGAAVAQVRRELVRPPPPAREPTRRPGRHRPWSSTSRPSRADPDPLEELRAVGARFRLKLPTLVKSALPARSPSSASADRPAVLDHRRSEAALDGGDAQPRRPTDLDYRE